MSTAQELINRAFSIARVKQQGHNLDSSESADGLSILNGILNEWSISKLMPYQKQEETHTLVASTNSYTIGSGGDIDTTRPTRILSAFVRDSNDRDYYLKVINKDAYDKIIDKTLETNYPDYLFYDPSFSLGKIYLYPAPNTAYTLHFVSELQFTNIATLGDTVSLPVGYEKALIYSMAVEISMEWVGEPTGILIAKLDKLLSNLENLNNNQEQGYTVYDPVFRKSNKQYLYNYTVGT